MRHLRDFIVSILATSIALSFCVVGSFAGIAAAATTGKGSGEQWLTTVTSPTSLKVGTAGLTITQAITSHSTTCFPSGATSTEFSGTNVTTYITPSKPASAVEQEELCNSTTDADDTVTVTFSQPLLDPVWYVVGLDASEVIVSGKSTTGATIHLKSIKENTLAKTTSTPNVLNPPPPRSQVNTGCENKTGTNPSGACGSFVLTAASGEIKSFKFHNTSNRPAGTDRWADSFSYPYETSIVPSFSTTTIVTGTTNTLKLTISNATTPTTFGNLRFTIPTLPAGLQYTSLTSAVTCGSPTVDKGNNTTTTPVSGSTGFGVRTITIPAGATCSISIKVKSDKAGTISLKHITIKTTAWNLVNTTNATFTSALPPPLNAPTITGVTSGNNSATVGLSPAATGDYTVTTYIVEAFATTNTLVATTTISSTTLPNAVVHGLINGHSYKFKAAEVNAGGTSPYSALSPSATPHATPTAPSGVTAVAGTNLTATVTWTRPATNGTAITGYVITIDKTSVFTTTKTVGVSPTSSLITGLSAGKTYNFAVKAKAGTNSATSAASSTITAHAKPATPAAPTTSTVQATKVKVTWLAPTDEGSAITHYIVEAIDATNAVVATKTLTAVLTTTFTTLTNGKSYTFRVAAQNGVGTSTFSPASAPVTPKSKPTAPTNVTAVAGTNLTATVSWTKPATNGTAITGYKVTVDSAATAPVATKTVGPSQTAALITGLVPSTKYHVRVITLATTNSTPSTPFVTVEARAKPATQAAPTTSTVGNQKVTLTWTRPATNGTALTHFVIEALSSTTTVVATKTVGVASTTLVFTGLTNGHAYKFKVAAQNGAGLGTFSPASTPAVTPHTKPSKPTAVIAVASSTGSVTVTWTRPATNGTPITGYKVTAHNTTTPSTTLFAESATPTSAKITGLTLGDKYTFKVTAEAVTNSTASTPSNAVTPATKPATPAAPTTSTVQATKVKVTWLAPTNEGSAITHYIVEAIDATNAVVATKTLTAVLTTTFTTLTNGKSYTFRVAAQNGVGTSTFSPASAPVTPKSKPTAPTNVTAIAGTNLTATVTWTRPATNGTPITGYVITIHEVTPSITTTKTVGASPTSSLITGLSAGKTYNFAVKAKAGTNSATSAASSTITAHAKPATPAAPTTSTVGNQKVKVTWVKPATNGTALTHFVIEALSSTTTVVATKTVGVASTTLVFTGLTNGHAYKFKVAAQNGAGLGTFSPASTPAVTPTVKPTPPFTVKAVLNQTGSVTLSWLEARTNSTTVTSYKVSASDSTTSGRDFTFTTPNRSPTSVNIPETKFSLGNIYYFKVKANAPIASATSVTSNALTPATKPTPPSKPTVTTVTSHKAKIHWVTSTTNGSAITGYVIEALSNTTVVEATKSVSGATSALTFTGLTNGKTYKFKVAALNGVGQSTFSPASTTYLIDAVPNAPTDVVAVANPTGSVTLTWNASVTNGVAVTKYTVGIHNLTTSTSTSLITTGPTPTEIKITGLSVGDLYDFTVAAVDVTGTSSVVSVLSNTVTVRTKPATPAAPTTSTVGNQKVKVTWVKPATNGTALTHFVIEALSSTTVVATKTVGVSSITSVFTGLTNGHAYKFKVAAQNGAGLGTFSPASTPAVVPHTAPSAPTNAHAVANATGSVTVAWTASVPNGTTITEYTVVAHNLTTTTTSYFTTASSVTPTSLNISGLTLGSDYNFSVFATATTDSATSVVSNTVVPAEVPAKITPKPTVTASNTKVKVTWTKPATNGSAISSYVIEAISATTTVVATKTVPGATSLTATVTGLVNGNSYTFRVAAKNSVGLGVFSTKSDPAEPHTAPSAPTNAHAVANATGSVTVAWTASVPNGTTITEYTVVAHNLTTTTTSYFTTASSVTPTSLNISGLTLGSDYNFSVFATATTDSATSVVSNTVVPAEVPAKITPKPTVTASNTKVKVTWTKPATNGSAISSYVIEAISATTTVVATKTVPGATSLTATVTGLVNGNSYTFRVAAKNSVGLGVFSTKSDPAEPHTAPSAPTNAHAVANATGSVTVAWTASVPNGTTITEYTVVAHNLTTTTTSYFTTASSVTPTSLNISGLTLGSDYNFSVFATATTDSATSVVSNTVVPAEVPAKITPKPTVTASNTKVKVTWTKPATNGSAISSYVIEAISATTTVVATKTVPGATSLTATVTGLVNGNSYTFRVAAKNSVGLGVFSTKSDPAEPHTAPSAPTNAHAVANATGSVTVAWTASVPNGTTITEYTVVAHNLTTTTTSYFTTASSVTPTSLNISGLTLGSDYNFSVFATATTDSATSVVSNTVVPAEVPAKITPKPTVTASNTKVKVTWTKPATNGSAISSYVIEAISATTTVVATKTVPGATSLTATVTGLVNGNSYTFRVAAKNSVGLGVFSTKSDPAEPHTAPSAPTNAHAVANATGSVTVAWTASVPNGTTITEYTVVAHNLTTTTTSYFTTASSVTPTSLNISGLTLGSDYNFSVFATATTDSATSVVSNTVVPAEVPAKITPKPTVTASNTKVKVTWTKPATNGSAISSYVIEAISATTTVVATKTVPGATSLTATVTGLVNGNSYTFRVAAKNSVGLGVFSTKSDPAEPHTAPSAPTNAHAVANATGSVTVAWTASVPNGTTITEYTVVAHNLTTTTTSYFTTASSVTPTSLNISGLTLGSDYNFSVFATATTDSATSVVSNTVVPAEVPAKITPKPTVTASNTKVKVTWTKPATNGSAISSYVIEAISATTTVVATKTVPGATSLTATVTGLVNGNSYTFRVAAKNSVGLGVFSTKSDPAEPHTAPSAPTNAHAVANATGSVTVAWTASVPNGTTITEYTVVAHNLTTTTTSYFTTASSVTPTSLNISGLTLGSDYNFSVFATATTDSATSVVSNTVVPAEVPAKITPKPTVTASNTKVKVTWTKPATNGSAISSYVIEAISATTTVVATKTVPGATSLTATVTGLVNGNSYTFRVAAKNSVGLGVFSTKSDPAEPHTAPSAPTNAHAVANATGSVTVAWTASVPNGTTITEYTVVAHNLTTTTTSYFTTASSVTPTSLNISGLTLGSDYNFSVFATATTDSATSVVSNTVVPAEVPAKITPKPTVTASNTKVKVTWTKPATNGSAISSYVIEAISATTTVVATKTVPGATSLTATVTGLVNGNSYTFRVAAKNSVGLGVFSTKSDPAEPHTAPSAPTNAHAVANATGSVTVAWTASVPNGTTITEYTVVAHNLTTTTTSYFTTASSVTPTSLNISGLTLGSDYNFSVFATATTDSATSVVSNTVVPAEVPAKITPKPTVTASNTKVKVTWTKPATNGSAISSYVIEAISATTTVVATKTVPGATSLTATVTGLVNGNSYTFRVAAKNSVGLGVFSTKSDPAEPHTAPSAPTNAHAVANATGSVTVAWTASVPNGTTITEYTVVAHNLTTTTTSYFTTASSVTPTSLNISGLTLGSDYNFSVFATATTDSATSVVSNTVVPAEVPAKITPKPTVTASNTKVKVTWTKPATNGNALTFYLVEAISATTTIVATKSVSPAVLTTTVTGLVNGDSYTFRVAAENLIGTGPYSTKSLIAEPHTKPSAPSNVIATANIDGSVTLTWTTPETNGTVITKYTITAHNNTTPTSNVTFTTTGTTPTKLTMSGLVLGDTYSFTVVADAKTPSTTSPASNKVTPATPPGKVTPAPTVVPGNSVISVSWKAPATNGGIVTQYLIEVVASTTTVIATKVVSSAQLSDSVTGLVNGDTYSVRVAAENGVGAGPYSTRSQTAEPHTKPSAPSNVVAVSRSNGAVTVSWSAPLGNGTKITKYTITAHNKTTHLTKTFSTSGPTPTTLSISGLIEGDTYTFSVVADAAMDSTPSPLSSPIQVAKPEGYWVTTADGAIYPYGNARYFGSSYSIKLKKPIVDTVATPDDGGYWEIGGDGGVFAFGDARFYGSEGNKTLVQPVIGMAPTAQGKGYWLVAKDGGVFSFGDARYYGSLPQKKIHVSDIVGIVRTSDGRGYWMVGADGGVFAFGDANFLGSLLKNHVHTNDIENFVPTPNNKGYWMLGSNGSVYAFGNARSYGSLIKRKLAHRVVGMTSTPDGQGYWIIDSAGDVFSFGDASYLGSPAGFIAGQKAVSVTSAGS